MVGVIAQELGTEAIYSKSSAIQPEQDSPHEEYCRTSFALMNIKVKLDYAASLDIFLVLGHPAGGLFAYN